MDPENARGVVERLGGISGVVVHEVLGPHGLVLDMDMDMDVNVDVDVDTQGESTLILRNKIRPLHVITNTVTCTCF